MLTALFWLLLGAALALIWNHRAPLQVAAVTGWVEAQIRRLLDRV